MKSWVRLYTNLPEKSKIQRLPDHLFRFLINCWCLTGKSPTETLPSLSDLSWVLKIDEEMCSAYVNHLESVGLFERDDEGNLSPHNWDAHQFASDNSTERVRKHRHLKGNVSCNVSETLLKRRTSVSESASESVSVKENKEVEVSFSLREWFEADIWPIYWRKVGKEAAFKAYSKKDRIKSRADHDEIVSAIKGQLPYYCLRAPEHRPHFGTWLNAGRHKEAFDESPPQFQFNGELPKESGMASRVPVLTKAERNREQLRQMLAARTKENVQ